MDGASNNPQDGLAPDPSGAATPHDPNPAAAGHAPPFLDIFVADPRDQTAKNCAATALLLMFPNPWLETEYTHARARLVEIYPELQARAEDFRNCALDMKGRVAGEPVLALADVIVRTRFVEAPGSEVRRALCKALVEMLAYDAGVTETSAFVEVARAFRLEMERLQEDPATADRPPETWGAWDLINWFDGEEGHNGSRAVIAWKKLKGTLQAALSTPQPPPAVGTIDWEDEAQPDLPQPMDLDDTGSLEAPTFFWGLPPPEGSPAYVRTEGAEARIGAALSTHSPLSAFTRGSTRDLAEEAIRTEVQRLLKSFDRATETKDRARMERALMRLLSISTGTHHNALVGLKWAEDSLAVDDMKYPGVLSRDARMLWRPELDPRGVDHPARGALPIPLADQLSRRLIVLAPEPGKRVFRHIDPDHRDREGEGVRPSIGALALALSARLMRREPWGMSLAQQVTGDFRGIDRAPLFYDEIDLASAAIEVARITFAWYGEKPGRMPALPIGIMGSRRVPPIAPVRACLQSIRNGYASAAGNFAEQLRHRTRNCMHGYALQGGFRVNERIESITRRNIGSDDPIAMVCDKVVASNWAVRPIALSKKWQQEYRVLLGELAYVCEEFEGTALGEAAAAALAGSGPVFLDIVDEDNVRPFGISAYREGVPAELDGLDNFARQLLNNRLTRRLPEPLRVAQMGWHGTREGAWAEGSPWSVSSAARLISPKLDEILMEVGWRALPSSRVARPIPDMPPLCWTKAWREHDRQFRGLVEMAKSALEERNSKTSQELLATLGSCIGHLHPGLKMDAHGKIERQEMSDSVPVLIGPSEVGRLRQILAGGDLRSVKSVVAQNLLHDLIADARQRGVLAGPLPRRIHARWPSRAGPFLLHSAGALEHARCLDAAVMASDLPQSIKTLVVVLLHGGYADVAVVLAAMGKGAAHSTLRSAPGILLIEPGQDGEQEGDRWTRGCLAFHGLAALHLGSWHRDGDDALPSISEIEQILHTLPPGTLPLRVAPGSSWLDELECLAKACNSIRMDGIARLVGTGEVTMTCAGLERVVAVRDVWAAKTVHANDRAPLLTPGDAGSAKAGHRPHGLLKLTFSVVNDACNQLDSGAVPEDKIRHALSHRLRGWLRPLHPPRGAELVVLYVLLLLERGGRRKEKLSLRTIRDYMYGIGQHLVRYMPEEPLAASAGQWESAYLEMVAEPDEEAIRRVRGEHLMNFHWVLAQEYEIPDVDFSTIHVLLGRHSDCADAGLLSDSELTTLVALLDSDVEYAEQRVNSSEVRLCKARRMATLLVGAYAARPGEATRLCHRDIQIAEDATRVIVRKNKIQMLKTSAARRKLLDHGVMSDQAATALNAWRDSERDSTTPHLPLFACGERNESRYDDSTLFQRPGMLIRMLTGDPNGRTYWLRKASARARLEALMHVHPSSLWPMRDLIAQIGHSSIRVTLTSYIHDPVTPFIRWFQDSWLRIDAGRIANAWGRSMSRVARTRGGRKLTTRVHDVTARISALLATLPLLRQGPQPESAPVQVPAFCNAIPWIGLYGVLESFASGRSLGMALQAHHWPRHLEPALAGALAQLREEHWISLDPSDAGLPKRDRFPVPRRMSSEVIRGLITTNEPSSVVAEMAVAWINAALFARADGVPAPERMWADWVERLPSLGRLNWVSKSFGRRGAVRVPRSDHPGGVCPWPQFRMVLISAWIYARLVEQSARSAEASQLSSWALEQPKTVE